MNIKTPTILCATCTHCEHIGIAKAGNLIVNCHPFSDKSITHYSSVMGKCKYYHGGEQK